MHAVHHSHPVFVIHVVIVRIFIQLILLPLLFALANVNLRQCSNIIWTPNWDRASMKNERVDCRETHQALFDFNVLGRGQQWSLRSECRQLSGWMLNCIGILLDNIWARILSGISRSMRSGCWASRSPQSHQMTFFVFRFFFRERKALPN